MTLKERLAKAQAVLKLETEIATYKDAVDRQHQFSDYCVSKAAELQVKLDRLLQE